MTTASLMREVQWPGLVNPDGSRWHYLDTAATAQKPQGVIDAMTRALGRDYATVHRGVYARSADMTLAFEAARRKVATSPTTKQWRNVSGASRNALATISGPMPEGSPWVMAMICMVFNRL